MPASDDFRTAPVDPADAHAVFRELERGMGHELVHDGNVDALIDIARARGHLLLEQELREWRSPCGDGSDSGGDLPGMVPASPPRPGPTEERS